MSNERIVVYVEPEYNAENPCDCDGWKVYSFGSRHYNFVDPYSIGIDPDTDQPDDELQAKIDAGLAFPLSYFEHGNCVWSLRGEGPSCPWDSVRFAGLLIWEQDEDDLGPSTNEERRIDAALFLQTYTAWCNGDCFWYRAVKVHDCETCGHEVEEHYDSCGGFIGADALAEGIRESLGDGPFEFRGTAASAVEPWECEVTT